MRFAVIKRMLCVSSTMAFIHSFIRYQRESFVARARANADGNMLVSFVQNDPMFVLICASPFVHVRIVYRI